MKTGIRGNKKLFDNVAFISMSIMLNNFIMLYAHDHSIFLAELFYQEGYTYCDNKIKYINNKNYK